MIGILLHYLPLIIYCIIGPLSFIIGEAMNYRDFRVKTRGEYIQHLFISIIFGPVIFVFLVSSTKWWNEKI